jgi:uncharacterized protein YbaR (Trm112 family)
MKPLTKQQLAGLIASVGATRDQELNCAECQSFAAEFAERQLAGLPLDEALARVEQHLVICPECREELLALKKILETNG